MDTNVSPIELDEDVLFIESEWIGQNKKHANAPDFVRWQKEKDSDMEMPLDILQFASFPKPEFSVNNFLALNFLGISSENISNNVACWFSNARQFRSVPAAAAIFQTHQYLLLSPIHFLTLLDYRASESSKRMMKMKTVIVTTTYLIFQ